MLVGHSYGGAVISQAAPLLNQVIALVFLSAFALDQGESCASIQEPFPAPMLASAIVTSPYDAPGASGGPDLFIKISEFHQAFCADLPAKRGGSDGGEPAAPQRGSPDGDRHHGRVEEPSILVHGLRAGQRHPGPTASATWPGA